MFVVENTQITLLQQMYWKMLKKKFSIMVPVNILLNWIKWSGLVQTSKEFIFSPGKDYQLIKKPGLFFTEFYAIVIMCVF